MWMFPDPQLGHDHLTFPLGLNIITSLCVFRFPSLTVSILIVSGLRISATHPLWRLAVAQPPRRRPSAPPVMLIQLVTTPLRLPAACKTILLERFETQLGNEETRINATHFRNTPAHCGASLGPYIRRMRIARALTNTLSRSPNGLSYTNCVCPHGNVQPEPAKGLPAHPAKIERPNDPAHHDTCSGMCRSRCSVSRPTMRQSNESWALQCGWTMANWSPRSRIANHSSGV